MRVFKGKQFSCWATGEAISDNNLCQAAAEAFAGQYDADLGGYLFKKRIARSDGGKSGGYRTLLGFRKSDSKRIFSAADVRRIRGRTRMSQPIFAVMLGVGASTVAQWEQGNKKPSGASARLLDVIDRKGIEAIA